MDKEITEMAEKLVGKKYMYEVNRYLSVTCTIRGVKREYGHIRILLAPEDGIGESWINIPPNYEKFIK